MYIMKLLVLAVFIVAAANAAISKNRADEIAAMVINDCKIQENGSDEDVEYLMKLENPKSDTGLCMIACIHEKLGFFADGKFLKDVFITEAEILTSNNAEYMEVAKIIVDKCADVGGSRCPQALNFALCMEKEILERNIELQFI